MKNHKQKSFFFVFLTFFSTTAHSNIKWKKPSTLITPSRFDVIIKYNYAKHRALNTQITWPAQLYKNHLEVLLNFNNNDNHYNISNSTFKTISTKFNFTLASIKKNGFESKNGSIHQGINGISHGAHRLAACLLYNKNIAVHKKVKKTISFLTGDFFKKKGLDSNYLDDLAISYCRLKENTYIGIFFPAATTNKDYNLIKKQLKHFGEIIYTKKVSLNNNGALNLLHLLYDEDSYKKNIAKEFAYKFQKYESKDLYSLEVFLLSFPSNKKARECKKHIREIFNPGKQIFEAKRAPLHINDYKFECIRAVETLFNENSIHFLNYSTHEYKATLNERLKKLKTLITQLKINQECLALDTGSVLAAYGIRSSGDLDILHHGYNDFISALCSNNFSDTCHVDDRNRISIKYHTTTVDELIFNPKNYFYYYGFKFVCLPEIIAWKKVRGRQKDQNDLMLTENHLNSLKCNS